MTFSGGEPCVQAEFVYETAKLLKERGLHIALDTCGDIDTPATDRLLALTDLVLLDLKFTTEEDYVRYCGGSLERTMRFLDKLQTAGKDTWIRHVVVPSINDTDKDVIRLASLLRGYSCVKRVDFLPFRTLCREKYESMGIPFALADTPQMPKDRLDELKIVFEANK